MEDDDQVATEIVHGLEAVDVTYRLPGGSVTYRLRGGRHGISAGQHIVWDRSKDPQVAMVQIRLSGVQDVRRVGEATRRYEAF